MKKGLTGLLLLVGLLLVGCGARVDVSQPPEIVYGQDVCSRCSMIISEENMAAAYWTADGEARRFDDIGGMLVYQQAQQEEVASWWVHDLHSAAWLRAEEAYFVMSSGRATPMGSGIVALAEETAAESLAAETAGAMVLDFAGLQAQAGNVMMHGH
ncbi:MAG: nitrous oxide reductase accessory protein NosL [Anaerolineales bacterium]|nr:nitrous oxide reductase accessory protein NosL [Anaerolineales bacterium]